MNKITRKLILSISACAMTLVCLTSTTYAWFARNSVAWIDDFKLQIQQHDGLVISVDGINYSTSIDNNTLFKAIAAKRLKKSINEVTKAEIDKSKASILEPVSTYDLKNFTTVNLNSKVENGYYIPDIASNDSYFEFDLYFRIDQSKANNDKDYYLTFAYNTDNTELMTKYYTHIKGVEETFKLSNRLSTIDKEYQSGEEITVNSGNAMRIGVLTNDGNPLIYEPNMGLGSYALEGEVLDNYNPNKNAMFTYFNNVHVDKLEALKDNHDIYKNTKKDFNGKDNLGLFEKNGTSYNDVKITVFIWLEGYDSDFIKGFDNNNFDNNKLNCLLSFRKEENK